jgi:metal-dependent hydrolase (beta-lactamase superfamily II)
MNAYHMHTNPMHVNKLIEAVLMYVQLHPSVKPFLSIFGFSLILDADAAIFLFDANSLHLMKRVMRMFILENGTYINRQRASVVAVI